MRLTILQDLIFALRQIRRSPGFALSVIITLAFGIGATTAVFTLVDGILLRPLPFPDHESLIAIDTVKFPPGALTTKPQAGYGIHSSYPNFFDWQRQNHSFESIASYDNQTRLIAKPNGDGDGARVINCGRVSANFFATLSVTPERTARSIVKRFDPDAPVFGYRSLADRLRMQSAQLRFEAALVSGFAATALLLSALRVLRSPLLCCSGAHEAASSKNHLRRLSLRHSHDGFAPGPRAWSFGNPYRDIRLVVRHQACG
jgi:hypothetical protein